MKLDNERLLIRNFNNIDSRIEFPRENNCMPWALISILVGEMNNFNTLDWPNKCVKQFRDRLKKKEKLSKWRSNFIHHFLDFFSDFLDWGQRITSLNWGEKEKVKNVPDFVRWSLVLRPMMVLMHWLYIKSIAECKYHKQIYYNTKSTFSLWLRLNFSLFFRFLFFTVLFFHFRLDSFCNLYALKFWPWFCGILIHLNVWHLM